MFFQDRDCLCRPYCPGTPSVDQLALNSTCLCLPSVRLKKILQACAIMNPLMRCRCFSNSEMGRNRSKPLTWLNPGLLFRTIFMLNWPRPKLLKIPHNVSKFQSRQACYITLQCNRQNKLVTLYHKEPNVIMYTSSIQCFPQDFSRLGKSWQARKYGGD